MLTLYITRHGETEWNTQKRMQGWQDSELTESGINNAVYLGKSLKDTPIDIVFSSPSNRTLKTASLICADRNIPIIIDENLKEMNMGVWEGETQSSIKENHPVEFHHFWNAPQHFTPVGGETFLETRDRALKALNRIKEDYHSGNILIVTHSVIIKCFISIIKNQSIEKIWDPPYIHDTSLTIVEAHGKKYKILLEGDISHKEVVL
ncbi:histidine phosphatase family protein [Psychrobacillus vulpis]|uniref:Histidine phosphatase family protein n=1 Tax=Psychrobacillus vulpis TaxID=2325572 RepID=A0A544TRN5_9BACI|nr:histidine phosphatase family protein [Psychrobacillus vulpis]TQR20109.1 histidine phosphatase family protein [Psychrobacillus vulpis]